MIWTESVWWCGTGKTTPFGASFWRFWLWWGCQSLFGRMTIRLAMTQDLNFDDSKTVLDTVLSSDLKEIQLGRGMVNHAQLQWGRGHGRNGLSPSLEKSQGQRQSSASCIQDLSTPVGELSGGLRKTGSVGASSLGNHEPLASGRAD